MKDSGSNSSCEPKLTRGDKELIIQRLAEFVPLKEIQTELGQLTGKTISLQAIDYYSKSDKWRSEIACKREMWLQVISDHIPLSNRKLRLMSLQSIHDKAEDFNIRLKVLKLIREEQDSAEKIKLTEALRSTCTLESQPANGGADDEDLSFDPEKATDEELKAKEAEIEEKVMRKGFMWIPLREYEPIWALNGDAFIAARRAFIEYVKDTVAPEFEARIENEYNQLRQKAFNERGSSCEVSIYDLPVLKQMQHAPASGSTPAS